MATLTLTPVTPGTVTLTTKTAGTLTLTTPSPGTLALTAAAERPLMTSPILETSTTLLTDAGMTISGAATGTLTLTPA